MSYTQLAHSTRHERGREREGEREKKGEQIKEKYSVKKVHQKRRCEWLVKVKKALDRAVQWMECLKLSVCSSSVFFFLHFFGVSSQGAVLRISYPMMLHETQEGSKFSCCP